MEHINSRLQSKESEFTYPAYYVESSSKDNRTDDTVLVAIDVKIRENYIEWFDTEKHRQFLATNTDLGDDGSISFTNPKSGMSYQLTPLTLDTYNANVKNHMYGSSLNFNTEEELWEALLSSVEDA